MKKIKILPIWIVILICMLCSCIKKERKLDPENPVTVSLWHVYGSQTDSPMNDMVEKFNQSVGKKKGIIINVTSVSNSSDIHNALVAASGGDAGAGELPDLFFCYPETAAIIGADKLIDWNEKFTKEELDAYIPSFLKEGTSDGSLLVFPVAKSSEVLFVNTTIFERFAADTGVTYNDLSTWKGLYQVCEKYYDWSHGKCFFMHDELLNLLQLNTIAQGGTVYTDKDINFSDSTFREQWNQLAREAIKGCICLEDTYATTCMMTGEIAASVESTASILYFQDTVTYADNTTEPLVLKVLPCPVADKGKRLAIQQGVGLCAKKSIKEKEEAAVIFAKWITDETTNLSFVTQSGYMPVKKKSFTAMKTYEFKNDSYQSLYDSILKMQNSYEFCLPPIVDGYYDILYKFYESSLSVLSDCKERYQNGEADLDTLTAESYQMLQDAMK